MPSTIDFNTNTFQFDQILELYRNATISSEKNTIIRSFGRAESPELVQRTLGMIFGSEIKNQDCTTALSGLRAHAHGIESLFEYLTKNWDLILKSVGNNPALLGGVVMVATSGATKPEQLAKVEAFFADKDTSAFDQSLNQSKDAIRSKIAWLERDREDVAAWVKANGYA